MSAWLVTGAQGFLGRYTVAQILRSDPNAQVVGMGRSPELADSFTHRVTAPSGLVPARFPAGFDLQQTGGYRYLSIDLANSVGVKALLQQIRPEYVIHLATALRGDPLSQLLRSNIEATASLFDAISAISGLSPVVVLGSTGGVYGHLAFSDLPVRESKCPYPADEYAMTKLAAEHVARNCARRYGIRLAVARIFNLLGPAQDERHVAAQIALKLSRSSRANESSVTIGALEATRDFLDVRDAAAALIRLATNPKAAGVVNVASGAECSIQHLLELFLKRAARDVAVQSVSGVPLDVPRHVGDVTLLADFGFKPHFPLKSSVDSIWSYYQDLWGS